MIYKPSNPLSVVFFLFSLILTGLFWIADWGIYSVSHDPVSTEVR